MTEERGPKYEEWAKEIKLRDNFVCKVCGAYKTRLESHHLYSWQEYPDKRFLHENGICLCKACHQDQFHKIYQFGNALWQFQQFVETYDLFKKLAMSSPSDDESISSHAEGDEE